MKRVAKLFVPLTMILTACTPGAQYTAPPGIALASGTDIPQQVASIAANVLTQTAIHATATPIPAVPTLPTAGLPSQKSYLSSFLGIQFNAAIYCFFGSY